MSNYNPEDAREDAVPSPDDGSEKVPPPGSAGARTTMDDAESPPTTV